MWFKNLQIFCLEQDWALTAGALEEKLTGKELKPCSALATESRGWVAPRDKGGLVEGVEKHLLIALGVEQKMLPTSVINDLAKQRAADFERQKGFKPGRKLLRDFKDQAAVELMPRAFVRRSQVNAWIDPAGKRLVVDTSSPARAEQLVEHLRETLGELPVTLLQTRGSVAETLSQWVSARQAPGRFDIAEQCELTSNDAAKSVVRYLRHSLDVVQVRRHLEEGMRCTSLALVWSQKLSLLLNEKLQVKKLRFLEIEESEESPAAGDAGREFDADFLLMTSQCGAMLDDLQLALDIKP